MFKTNKLLDLIWGKFVFWNESRLVFADVTKVKAFTDVYWSEANETVVTNINRLDSDSDSKLTDVDLKKAQAQWAEADAQILHLPDNIKTNSSVTTIRAEVAKVITVWADTNANFEIIRTNANALRELIATYESQQAVPIQQLAQSMKDSTWTSFNTIILWLKLPTKVQNIIAPTSTANPSFFEFTKKKFNSLAKPETDQKAFVAFVDFLRKPNNVEGLFKSWVEIKINDLFLMWQWEEAWNQTEIASNKLRDAITKMWNDKDNYIWSLAVKYLWVDLVEGLVREKWLLWFIARLLLGIDLDKFKWLDASSNVVDTLMKDPKYKSNFDKNASGKNAFNIHNEKFGINPDNGFAKVISIITSKSDQDKWWKLSQDWKNSLIGLTNNDPSLEQFVGDLSQWDMVIDNYVEEASKTSDWTKVIRASFEDANWARIVAANYAPEQEGSMFDTVFEIFNKWWNFVDGATEKIKSMYSWDKDKAIKMLEVYKRWWGSEVGPAIRVTRQVPWTRILEFRFASMDKIDTLIEKLKWGVVAWWPEAKVS